MFIFDICRLFLRGCLLLCRLRNELIDPTFVSIFALLLLLPFLLLLSLQIFHKFRFLAPSSPFLFFVNFKTDQSLCARLMNFLTLRLVHLHVPLMALSFSLPQAVLLFPLGVKGLTLAICRSSITKALLLISVARLNLRLIDG